jgi:hypothetical protein
MQCVNLFYHFKFLKVKFTSLRRSRSRRAASSENGFFRKENRQEQTFFTRSLQPSFFQPASAIQRKCEKCEEDDKKQRLMPEKKDEDKKVQRQPLKKEEEKIQKKESPVVVPVANTISHPGSAQQLPADVNHFYSSRMGRDFSDVNIYSGTEAAKSASEINARAYTTGNHIVFNEGQYNLTSAEGKKLLAHELTHVIQQGSGTGNRIQRAVQFNVLNWDAAALGSPALTNAPDPRMILIPPTNQIIISGLVETNGAAGDRCSDYEFGTIQTAWMAWVHQYFRGRTAADGSIVVRYNAAMPMRDPGVAGNIWYDNGRVRSPASCGDATGIFHNDAPWQAIPKARNNSSVPGNPLNYLTGYTRGLHLVNYLTGKLKGGNYLRSPLKFRYWNSIQDFSFTPNYVTPLAMWAYAGGIRVNIGSQGSGETGDAPYYITAGTKYNDHFNNGGNWIVSERH